MEYAWSPRALAVPAPRLYEAGSCDLEVARSRHPVVLSAVEVECCSFARPHCTSSTHTRKTRTDRMFHATPVPVQGAGACPCYLYKLVSHQCHNHAFWVTHSFFVVTRHHEVPFGWYLVEIFPRRFPNLFLGTPEWMSITKTKSRIIEALEI